MTEFLDKLFSSKALKAWVASGVAVVGAVVAALQDGVFDSADFGVVAATLAAALGLVYRVPNAKSE